MTHVQGVFNDILMAARQTCWLGEGVMGALVRPSCRQPGSSDRWSSHSEGRRLAVDACRCLIGLSIPHLGV